MVRTYGYINQIYWKSNHFFQIECHGVKQKMFDLQEGVNLTHLSQPVVYLWMATSVPSTVLFQQEHRHSICPWSPCQEGITSENIFHSQVLRFYLSPSCSFHNCLLTTWARSGLCSRDTMANKTKINQEYNDAICHPTCSLTANALRPQGLHEVCSSERSAWVPGLHPTD